MLTTSSSWESPEQGATDFAHKKMNTIQDRSWFHMPVSSQENRVGEHLGVSEPWYVHLCGKEMKCKYFFTHIDMQKE